MVSGSVGGGRMAEAALENIASEAVMITSDASRRVEELEEMIVDAIETSGANSDAAHFVLVPLAMLMSALMGMGLRQVSGGRMPRVVAHLLAGIILGPSSPLGITLLQTGDVAALHLVLDSVCLGAIAVSAGSELVLAECRKSLRAIMTLVVAITVASMGVTFIASLLGILYFDARYDTGMADATANGSSASASTSIGPPMFTVASIVAVVAAARSPASAIAVLDEVGGRGSFCSLTLSVIVAKDVLVFVLFALLVGVMGVTPGMVGRIDADVEKLVDEITSPTSRVNRDLRDVGDILAIVLTPIVQVGVALGVGYIGSIAFVALLKLRLPTRQENILRPAALLLMAATVFTLTDHLNAEPMLANVTVGLMVANQPAAAAATAALMPGSGGGGGAGTASGSDQNVRDTLERSYGVVMPYVNLVFFTMIGATVTVNNISETIAISLCIFVSRILGIMLGCRIGYWFGGAPNEHARFAWMAYVTQAGVALGLVKTVTIKFPELGKTVASYLVTVILINMVMGPMFFKIAIFSAGEAKLSRAGSTKLSREPVVVAAGKEVNV